ncbi:hypothetical protein SAMN04490248_1642 [Salinihabitans flavidus]|uniref:Nuclease homologue n=1 Tax=Salinihabitans flavidus TaxID=569882 RepID=A0A1H8WHS0_9RHOB|nr:hypothetical protein SAMN04490248_1642 [Salinihabitans flavidus]
MVSSGRSIEGHVTYVRDGNTIEVAYVPVRIAKLDCAESGSMAGNRATKRMHACALGNGTVQIERQEIV